MLNSDYRRLCAVKLPYSGRQSYMHTFDLSDPVMAPGFEDYMPIVQSLCDAVGSISGFAHMTVDEKVVVAGMSQRRPRPHVDGCFMPASGWDHDPDPYWAHGCNNIPVGTFKRMSVIVAASVRGCRAWRGRFDAQPASDGDLSHLELGEGEVLSENTGYLLSPDCVHESMLQPMDVQRSFLRIALPVAFDFAGCPQ